MKDIAALKLLSQNIDALKQVPTPKDRDKKCLLKYGNVVRNTKENMQNISQYIQHIQEELKEVKGVLQASAVTIGKYVQELMASIIKCSNGQQSSNGSNGQQPAHGMSKSHGKASKYVHDIPVAVDDKELSPTEHRNTGSDKRGYSNKDDVATLKMQNDLEKQLMDLLDCVKKLEEIIPAIMSEANPDTAKEIKDISQLLNDWHNAVKRLEEEEAERKRREEQKIIDEKQREEEEKRHQERKEQEEIEKKKKEEEEKRRKEQEETERRRKEEDEKRRKDEIEIANRKREELEKRKKEREEKEKEQKKKEQEELEKRKMIEEEIRRKKEEEEKLRLKEEEEKKQEDENKRQKELEERRQKELIQAKKEKEKKCKADNERRSKEYKQKKEEEKRQKEEQEHAEEYNKTIAFKKRQIECQRKKDSYQEVRKMKEALEEEQKRKEEREEAEKKEKANQIIKINIMKNEEQKIEKKINDEKEAERKKRQAEEEKTQKKLKDAIEADRKKQAEEAERQRQQEESDRIKRKEEAERKKREEAAQKLKEEEEKKQFERNKKENWPPFIYYNKKKNKFKQEICCVIFTMPDGIKEDDFECKCSDDKLDECLETNDEEIVSSNITISPNKKKKITSKMPIRIHVPIVSHDDNLMSILKFKLNDEKWKTGKPLREIKLPNKYDRTFVGIELTFKELHKLQVVAIATSKRELVVVDEKGQAFELDMERNFKIKIPPKAFREQTTVSSLAIQWNQKDIKQAAKLYKELRNVKPAGSYIDVACENKTENDGEIEIYDFGWVADAKLQQEQSVSQETIHRCSKYLIQNLNSNNESVIADDDVFDSDFVGELKKIDPQQTGDKNRHILRQLHYSKDGGFDKFIKRLSKTQPGIAKRVQAVQAQVRLSRKDNRSTYEDDFASDFDPDFQKTEGKVCVVSKVSGRPWQVVPLRDNKEFPQSKIVKLPAGNDRFKFLGLVVPEDMSNADICKAAEILESLNCSSRLTIVCRQKRTNQYDFVIECLKPEEKAERLEMLKELEYTIGPPESAELAVVDGEEIEIKFGSNLWLEDYKETPLKIKFFKHLPCEKISMHLEVVNKRDQADDDSYHGYMKYQVTPARLSLQRKGSFVIYIPKPLKEIVLNFPFTEDIQVKVIAKFIACQMAGGNPDSTRWVVYANTLTADNKNLYSNIYRIIDDRNKEARQLERCEKFILYWANHHASETDKISRIIGAHHDKKLQKEVNQMLKLYTPGKGPFSNDNLEKMAFVLNEDWEYLALTLDFHAEEIKHIKSIHPGVIRPALKMLDIWRSRESVINQGIALVKIFQTSAKSAKCSPKFIQMITEIFGHLMLH